MPLANTSVTLAGQPSKVGGTVARIFGWLVLAGGWLVAALLAGLIVLLGGEWAAVVVGGPIALLASVVAYALLRSGKELKKSGDDTEQATKNQAIFALANTRGGVLDAWHVAQMLHVTPKEADDVLTKLAKEYPDYVTVDLDDHGNVLYRFLAFAQMAPNVPFVPNVVPHVRVSSPTRVAPDASVGVDAVHAPDAREPIEDELAEADPGRRRAR